MSKQKKKKETTDCRINIKWASGHHKQILDIIQTLAVVLHRVTNEQPLGGDSLWIHEPLEKGTVESD